MSQLIAESKLALKGDNKTTFSQRYVRAAVKLVGRLQVGLRVLIMRKAVWDGFACPILRMMQA